jgi:ABC-type glycerol-3-phosphate transport system substrate-binding protein
MRKKGILLIMAVLMAALLTGCGKKEIPNGAYDNEIITTKAVDQKKTVITLRVEFGAGQQDNLEKVIEEKFPNVDIVLRHDGSASSVYTMRANLEAGVECDLIMSRRLPVVSDIAQKYLLDLSAEKFVDNYYLTALESCADLDGKLYYLPGPSDVYGIVYDKTMFEENGWELPKSYSDFVSLLKTIRKSGVKSLKTPIQPSLMYPDMFQILFNTYGYEEAYSGSDNFLWLTEYQNGNGSMKGHMEAAVDKFKGLFEDGILSVSDMDVTPSERSQMMYVDHSTAMIIECQNALDYQKSMNEGKDESELHDLAMMPFWTEDKEDSDYLYSIPSYYLAINKKSAEESKEKKELLLDIYEYLSSVEGQEMLIGDNFQLSNIEGVSINENDFSENIISTIQRGQVINTFYLASGETDKQVERQMLGTAKDMINGKMSVKKWLQAADEVRDQWISGELGKEESYGQVETTMTRLETAYTMADMYRSVMGADIGICLAGGWDKSTNGYFYQGDITDSSLACITPEKESQSEEQDSTENKIVSASLTGQQILNILNSSVDSGDTKGLSTYYVASGLEVKFNPWAEEGKRVVSCKLPDGSKIETGKMYQVAYFNGSLPNMDVEPEQVHEQTWQETFLQWLKDKGGTLQKPEMTLTLVY